MSTTAYALPASASNVDPPLKTESADVSGGNYTPTDSAYAIRGINCSVAGIVSLVEKSTGNTITEYMNTGWNPCTISTSILTSGTTATVKRAALTRISIAI